MLLSMREKVGLKMEEEAYLLAKAPKGMALNGWYQLNKMCKLACCKNVRNITSTNMRKYLATIAQVMDLKENEMDQVAAHLGHDVNVHRRQRTQDLFASTVCLTARWNWQRSPNSCSPLKLSWRRTWMQIHSPPTY